MMETQDLTPQSISGLASAFAAFTFTPEDPTTSFVEVVEIRLQKQRFNAQSLCNLLWELSFSQVSDDYRGAQPRDKEEGLSLEDEGSSQLHP